MHNRARNVPPFTDVGDVKMVAIIKCDAHVEQSCMLAMLHTFGQSPIRIRVMGDKLGAHVMVARSL